MGAASAAPIFFNETKLLKIIRQLLSLHYFLLDIYRATAEIHMEIQHMFAEKKSEIITNLRAEIQRMQGFKPGNSVTLSAFGPLATAFPNATFPLGAIHEFVTHESASAAATSGFVSCLIACLTQANGVVLWVGRTSSPTKIFPPALSAYGLTPEHFLFVHVRSDKDALWAMEEALKCGALTAVVAEMNALSFMASRRLQLAVEQSQVTGFVIRSNKQTTQTACVSRWRIASVVSVAPDAIPGVGHAAWQVTLEKMRHGKSGSWQLQWIDRTFKQIADANTASAAVQRIREAV